MFTLYIIKIVKRNTELLKMIISLYERNAKLFKEKREVLKQLQFYIDRYGKPTGDGCDNRNS